MRCLLSSKSVWFVMMLFGVCRGIESMQKKINKEDLLVPWLHHQKTFLDPSALKMPYSVYKQYVQHGPCILIGLIEAMPKNAKVNYLQVSLENQQTLATIFSSLKPSETNRNLMYFFALKEESSSTYRTPIRYCNGLRHLLNKGGEPLLMKEINNMNACMNKLETLYLLTKILILREARQRFILKYYEQINTLPWETFTFSNQQQYLSAEMIKKEAEHYAVGPETMIKTTTATSDQISTKENDVIDDISDAEFLKHLLDTSNKRTFDYTDTDETDIFSEPLHKKPKN